MDVYTLIICSCLLSSTMTTRYMSTRWSTFRVSCLALLRLDACLHADHLFVFLVQHYDDQMHVYTLIICSCFLSSIMTIRYMSTRWSPVRVCCPALWWPEMYVYTPIICSCFLSSTMAIRCMSKRWPSVLVSCPALWRSDACLHADHLFVFLVQLYDDQMHVYTLIICSCFLSSAMTARCMSIRR